MGDGCAPGDQVSVNWLLRTSGRSHVPIDMAGEPVAAGESGTGPALGGACIGEPCAGTWAPGTRVRSSLIPFARWKRRPNAWISISLSRLMSIARSASPLISCSRSLSCVVWSYPLCCAQATTSCTLQSVGSPAGTPLGAAAGSAAAGMPPGAAAGSGAAGMPPGAAAGSGAAGASVRTGSGTAGGTGGVVVPTGAVVSAALSATFMSDTPWATAVVSASGVGMNGLVSPAGAGGFAAGSASCERGFSGEDLVKKLPGTLGSSAETNVRVDSLRSSGSLGCVSSAGTADAGALGSGMAGAGGAAGSGCVTVMLAGSGAGGAAGSGCVTGMLVGSGAGCGAGCAGSGSAGCGTASARCSPAARLAAPRPAPAAPAAPSAASCGMPACVASGAVCAGCAGSAGAESAGAGAGRGCSWGARCAASPATGRPPAAGRPSPSSSLSSLISRLATAEDGCSARSRSARAVSRSNRSPASCFQGSSCCSACSSARLRRAFCASAARAAERAAKSCTPLASSSSTSASVPWLPAANESRAVSCGAAASLPCSSVMASSMSAMVERTTPGCCWSPGACLLPEAAAPAAFCAIFSATGWS